MNLLNLKVATATVFVALAVLETGCKQGEGQKKDPNVDYYTCTMHPSVKSQDPKAKCPICSMDLVPVAKKGPGSDGVKGMQGGEVAGPQTSEFTVPVERQQQIGVRYAEARRQPMHHAIRSVGVIVPDKGRRWGYVARVEGYVEKLHVTSPGELVEEGQPLMTIYSPELLTSSREFVNLLEARDRAASPEARRSTERLIQSARFRLEQWNVTARQIAELEKSRKPSEFLALYSPFKGVIEEVPVDQGRRLMIGDRLVDVANLSVVWVWAEFYEDELSMLKKGLKVAITSNSYPGEKFDGELGLVNPFLNTTMRTGQVRVDIPNPDLRLRPGMYVNIELGMDMGEGLAIPVSAVMPTGSRSLVFIDKGEGRIEPRFVQLGRKYGDFYEVQEGLNEGERVLASANFLIDAESKVQGAVKNFEEPPPSAKPVAGETAEKIALPEEARALWAPFFEAYLAVQKKLAADMLDGVAGQGEVLRKQLGVIADSKVEPPKEAEVYRARLEALKQSLAKFQPADLEQARVQLGAFSFDLLALATKFPPPLNRPLHVFECPMWKKPHNSWVQTEHEPKNPFMGPAMLDCGQMLSTLGAER